jgi:hypothetical protein
MEGSSSQAHQKSQLCCEVCSLFLHQQGLLSKVFQNIGEKRNGGRQGNHCRRTERPLPQEGRDCPLGVLDAPCTQSFRRHRWNLRSSTPHPTILFSGLIALLSFCSCRLFCHFSSCSGDWSTDSS